jgi:hypothetical protein
MKFRFLTGDANWLDYGAKWISPKQKNGDFDYWLVIELTNMDDACGRDNEGQPRYNVSVSAVSPSEAGPENLKRAMDGFGESTVNPVLQVEALHSYGVSSVLWQGNGNNAHKLLSEARKQAHVHSSLFGFAMDRAQNRIGTTGWEAIRGDLDSGIARTIASGSPTGNILAKTYGVSST